MSLARASVTSQSANLPAAGRLKAAGVAIR
jgi:hypothetical protein